MVTGMTKAADWSRTRSGTRWTERSRKPCPLRWTRTCRNLLSEGSWLCRALRSRWQRTGTGLRPGHLLWISPMPEKSFPAKHCTCWWS